MSDNMTCSVCGETVVRAARWARLRFVLGMTQIAGAGLSFALIILKGAAPATLAAVALTSAATTVSVMLFGGRRAVR